MYFLLLHKKQYIWEQAFYFPVLRYYVAGGRKPVRKRKQGRWKRDIRHACRALSLGWCCPFLSIGPIFLAFVCVLLGYNCILCVINIKPTGWTGCFSPAKEKKLHVIRIKISNYECFLDFLFERLILFTKGLYED